MAIKSTFIFIILLITVLIFYFLLTFIITLQALLIIFLFIMMFHDSFLFVLSLEPTLFRFFLACLRVLLHLFFMIHRLDLTLYPYEDSTLHLVLASIWLLVLEVGNLALANSSFFFFLFKFPLLLLIFLAFWQNFLANNFFYLHYFLTYF